MDISYGTDDGRPHKRFTIVLQEGGLVEELRLKADLARMK